MNHKLLDPVLVFNHPRLPTEKPMPGFIVALHEDDTVDCVVISDRKRLSQSQPATRVLGPIPVLSADVTCLPGSRAAYCAYLRDERTELPAPKPSRAARTMPETAAAR